MPLQASSILVNYPLLRYRYGARVPKAGNIDTTGQIAWILSSSTARLKSEIKESELVVVVKFRYQLFTLDGAIVRSNMTIRPFVRMSLLL